MHNSVVVRPAACGGYFHTPNGTIRYPDSNATLQYGANLNCAWAIDVESAYVVNVTFDWIDVENSTDCRYDSVTVKFDRRTRIDSGVYFFLSFELF